MKKQVFNYILGSIDGDNYGVELTTDKQKVDFVYDTFRSEYGYQILYYGGNEVKAFSEYLAGLPSCINIEFRNYYILELAKMWGSIPQDATEKQEDKIIDNWFNYIAVNFFQMRSKLTTKDYLSKAYQLDKVN